MLNDSGMGVHQAETYEKSHTIVFPEVFSIKEMEQFKQKAEEFIERGKIHLTLDFEKCDFIDSTGIGIIVYIHKKCRLASGSLRIISVTVPVMKLFEITHLNRLFSIEQLV